MSATLKRRIRQIEIMTGTEAGSELPGALVEPSAGASDEQWRKFALRRAQVDRAGRSTILVRAGNPARPMSYQGRLVIVPPKIPALVETRPLPSVQ